MKLCSFTELKCKEVINVCDGRRLGFVSNAEFEVPGGQIVSISVPADNKCFTFGKVEEIRIPWSYTSGPSAHRRGSCSHRCRS